MAIKLSSIIALLNHLSPKQGRLAFLFALGCALSACQTGSDRLAELSRICANPENRAIGTFYYGECQTLYPLSPRQFQQQEELARGVGDG